MDSFVIQLLMPALGTHPDTGCQEDFEHCVREHDRAHVTAVGDQAGRPAVGLLALQEHRPDRRDPGHFGGGNACRLVAQLVRNILS